MLTGNFKKITAIPSSKEFMDIFLSKMQRKTPTIVHPGYAIQQIRRFYIRKVKFAQDQVHEKFNQILEQFPKIDDIHPFYADLMNILYDRDHYKLALGHINKAMSLVDSLTKDYVRMMKYSESLYRCKMLKRAAIGRMCTIIKKLNSSFNYLEEVRKHMARLPTIDPNTRTLLLTGFPNVGKSSFINNVTNANVDVQPYPFTTQNLFVGHTEYQHATWQVLDSPGLLDHSLEKRNTIEMQAITALAHLNACIIYIVDISETCGYTLDDQVSLFNNLKPLFLNKPLVIALNKTDLCKWDDVRPEARAKIEEIAKERKATMMAMSTKTGEGINDVKNKACDILLEYRLAIKTQNEAHITPILSRIHVAVPIKRDDKNRPPIIPDSVEDNRTMTIRDLQEQNGGAGVFYVPTQEHFMLENVDWKYDAVPEIMDGKNIADFYDPEIKERLDLLEKEEEQLEQLEEMKEDIPMPDSEIVEEYKKVGKRKDLLKQSRHLAPQKKLHKKSMSTNEAEHIGASEGNKIKTKRFKIRDEIGESMESDGMKGGLRIKKTIRKMERSRVQGKAVGEVADRIKRKLEKKWKPLSFGDTMPKHLNTGKRTIGKHDRR